MLWHRFWPPPAPAKAAAPISSANPSSVGNLAEVENPLGSARQLSGEIASQIAMIISTTTAATLTNSSRSSATYTTGASVSEAPITISATMAM